MKRTIAVAGILCAVLAGSAFADNSQQDRMKSCNQQATGMKGDDRATFMKGCLSGQAAAPAKPMTPQERMTQCNKDAAGKTGDERKAFMSDCLKAKKPS